MQAFSFDQIICQFVGKHKGWVFSTVGLMLVHFPIEMILLSYLSGKIFVKMSNMRANYASVVRLMMLFFLAYFTIEVCLVLRDTYDSYIVPELEREIRNHVIHMLMNKNEVSFDNMEMGEIIARFLKTPAYSFYSYAIMTKYVVPFAAAIVGIGFYVLFLNRQAGILYFLMFSIYLLIFAKLCMIMLRQTEKKMIAEMVMFNQIEDTLSNIHTIFTCDKKEQELAYMDKVQHAFISIHQQEMRMNTKIKLAMSALSLIATVLLCTYILYLYKKRRISQETLISFATLFLFMVRFLGYTSRRIIEGMITIGSMMESNQYMDKLRQNTLRDGDKTGFITEGQIEFRDVSFQYSEKHPLIFSKFSIIIPAKTRLVLIGDSGSGKSTFLRLMLGFYQLQGGKVLIDGTDIHQSKRGYLRKHIAYINQTTKLFDRTLMENILYGCEGVTEKDVIEFVEKNKLSSLFEKQGANWMHKKAGKGGENLSGGMRQIILLLRCVFRNCPITIIDEATTSIDQKHRHYAVLLIKEMFKTKTVICVSHDKEIIALFDKQLRFSSQSPPLLVVSTSNSASC